jgi:hypothetical protein
MGYGGYSHDAHEAVTTARATKSVHEVFAQTATHALMTPYGVKVRESRDSARHPESLGIVFALDVTGSMSGIPADLARKHLPSFMRTVMDIGVSDPQLLFVGVGDVYSDTSPLQVGQFESEAQAMDRWLTGIHLEGGGGGGTCESYETALAWLATHTSMDCYEKRGKKGYLFMTGDENPYPSLFSGTGRRGTAATLFGDGWPQIPEMKVADVVAEVAKTYHFFFLIPDTRRAKTCERTWRDLIGDHVIVMDTSDDTVAVSAALLALTEGVLENVDAVATHFRSSGMERGAVSRVISAITPYAASLSRDGVPAPRLAPVEPDGELTASERRAARRSANSA